MKYTLENYREDHFSGLLVLGDLMAPDLEKRRQELRRTNSCTLEQGHEHLQMLLQLRCTGNALIEPYRHGKLDPSPYAYASLLLFNIQRLDHAYIGLVIDISSRNQLFLCVVFSILSFLFFFYCLSSLTCDLRRDFE